MTKAWLEAGDKTVAVDIPGEKLVFRRVRGPEAPESAVAHEGLQESTAPFVRRSGIPASDFMKRADQDRRGLGPDQAVDDEPWEKGYLRNNYTK